MKRRRTTQGGLVLIADGDLDRAKRLEQACVARGYETHVVRHGAAALEAALAETPDVLIVPEGLSLIDAPKLAEILRSNPRRSHQKTDRAAARSNSVASVHSVATRNQ